MDTRRNRTLLSATVSIASGALIAACGSPAEQGDPSSTQGGPASQVAGLAAPSSASSSASVEEFDGAAAQDAGEGGGYFTCNADDDCVAVRKLYDCCYNGWKIAVARDEAAAYLAATACTDTGRHFCPLYIVFDRRVPACDVAARQCIMVQPPSTSSE
jgi:hypothetical protein